MERRRGVRPDDCSRRPHEAEETNEHMMEEARALAALSRSRLKELGPSRLLRLYRSNESHRYRPNQQLPERCPGFWVVLDGTVELRTSNKRVPTTLGTGSVWNVKKGSKGCTGPAGAWVLFVKNHGALEALEWNQARHGSSSGHLRLVVPAEPCPVVRVLQLRSQERLNLAALTKLLARTIVHDFKDTVVIVRKGTRPSCKRVGSHLFQASLVDGHLPFHPDAFDYIFADEEAAHLLEQHHPRFQHTLLQLTRKRSPAMPEPTKDTLLTLLMPVAPGPVDGGREGAADAEKPPLEQRSCWLHLPDDVLSGACTRLEELDERTRQHLSRWARAVTHRKVGLALSGGGVWGFYHYVVLKELTCRKVPIDVITGSSIGSVMGAYYSVLGMDGLELFRHRCNRGDLQLLSWLNMLSTAPLEGLVRWDLGEVQLEELSLRVHPVALNLTTAKATVFKCGPLDRAVRASCSAPGLWGPTLQRPCRLVDGATVRDIPAMWLPFVGTGVDLTFSCNCFPAQRRPYQQLFPGSIGRLLTGLNPVGRLLDLIASGCSLIHASGDLGARMSTQSFYKTPVEDSLARAINFRRADEIICLAHQDPALNESLDLFVKDWEKCRARRGQLREPEPRRAVR